MRVLYSLMVLWIVSPFALAQAPVPKGQVPQIGLASAVEKDGKVAIEVSELREVVRVKMPNGGDVFLEERHWQPITTGTLGEDIRAYKPDGKPATTREVLTALTKPRGIVYFLGYDKKKPIEPDPFFLGLLKEGNVALAFERPELAPPTPLP